MALKAANPLSPRWWMPESQKDDPCPTEFKIQGLPQDVHADVEAELIVRDGMIQGVKGKGLTLALQYGLLDWKNFHDENDKPLMFTPANRRRIPSQLGALLVIQILAASTLSEEAQKN